jgi:hypothetical protein
MKEPIDLAARRKEKRRAGRAATLQRWAPSRAVLAWTVLVGVAAVTYLAFGRGQSFNQADMSAAMQPGGIGECGWYRQTCLVDGDTGWQDGTKWRLLNIDAPEMGGGAECAAEKEKAQASLERLKQLMADGYSIKNSGRQDKYGRSLVDVVLADGRDAGRVLLQDGLAQPWPNQGNLWCGR